MVQIKQVKNNLNNSKIGKQKQPQKTQLQFASSDEESDDELEDEEAEDEELLDEEMEDEEMEDEELEDEEELEEEEDEEEEEGHVPTKAELAAAKKKVENKKVPEKQSKAVEKQSKTAEKQSKAAEKQSKAVEKQSKAVEKQPKAAEKQPKAVEKPETPAEKKKVNGAEKNDKSAQKRKADSAVASKTPVKQSRLVDESSIMTEESRRREDRNKRSLFLKGAGKLLKKASEIKALHPDIISVRTMGINAWVLFPTEAACIKAHKLLEDKSVNGKKLIVDFCGSKAKHPTKNNSNLDKPLNKLALLVSGLPTGTTVDKLKVIFPTSKSIEIPKSRKKNTTVNAFVHFATEQEAQAAFGKNEQLKVGGAPVEVLYARQRIDKDKS